MAGGILALEGDRVMEVRAVQCILSTWLRRAGDFDGCGSDTSRSARLSSWYPRIDAAAARTDGTHNRRDRPRNGSGRIITCALNGGMRPSSSSAHIQGAANPAPTKRFSRPAAGSAQLPCPIAPCRFKGGILAAQPDPCGVGGPDAQCIASGWASGFCTGVGPGLRVAVASAATISAPRQTVVRSAG